MSEYVSASVEIDTRSGAPAVAAEAGLGTAAAAVACSVVVIAGVAQALGWLLSRLEEGVPDLEQLAPVDLGLDRSTCTRTQQDLRYTSALRTTLARPELDLLRASIEAEGGRELKEATNLLDRLVTTPPLEVRAVEAREARSLLEQAVSKGAARQLAAEERLLERATSEALREIGYQVRSTRNPRTGRVALRAEHPQRKTRVVVDLDARKEHLAADFAGFSGTACAEERDRLLGALSRRGYRTRVDGQFRHGLETGGPLSREIDRLFGIAGAGAPSIHNHSVAGPTRVGG